MATRSSEDRPAPAPPRGAGDRAAARVIPRPVRAGSGGAFAEPEAVFQRKVVELARIARWRVYFTHDSRHSPAGFPDLVLLRGRRLLFVELKSDTGVVSREQAEWIADLAAAGQAVYVWRPAQWLEIVRLLQERP